MDDITTHPRHLLTRLQREWNRLAVSPAALARARRWPISDDRLSSLDELLRTAGYGVVVKGGHGDDPMLHQLIRLAAHDELAARVVLQRLLPGISSMCRRHSTSYADALANVDDAVATAWSVIRLYPVERRRRYVAASVLREIEYRTFRRERRRKAEFIPTPAKILELTPALGERIDPGDEVRELLGEARRAGFDAADVVLAERLAAGAKTSTLATERKVTTRTIRNHRAIVVHRLRQLALACA